MYIYITINNKHLFSWFIISISLISFSIHMIRIIFKKYQISPPPNPWKKIRSKPLAPAVAQWNPRSESSNLIEAKLSHQVLRFQVKPGVLGLSFIAYVCYVFNDCYIFTSYNIYMYICIYPYVNVFFFKIMFWGYVWCFEYLLLISGVLTWTEIIRKNNYTNLKTLYEKIMFILYIMFFNVF